MKEYEADFLEDHSDDIYGLWEINWYLEGKKIETMDEKINFVIDLVERQLVDVFIADDPVNHGKALSSADALDTVKHLECWIEPKQDFHGSLCYISTSQDTSSLQNG